MGIRLTQLSTGLKVEAELGKKFLMEKKIAKKMGKIFAKNIFTKELSRFEIQLTHNPGS